MSSLKMLKMPPMTDNSHAVKMVLQKKKFSYDYVLSFYLLIIILFLKIIWEAFIHIFQACWETFETFIFNG
jgi:hypothetical protein